MRTRNDCARCGNPLLTSTATVRGDERYPAYLLRAGDPLCAGCDRDRARAFGATRTPDCGGDPSCLTHQGGSQHMLSGKECRKTR